MADSRNTTPGGPLPLELEAAPIATRLRWLVNHAPEEPLLGAFFARYCLPGEAPNTHYFRCGFPHNKHFESRFYLVKHLHNKHAGAIAEAREKVSV